MIADNNNDYNITYCMYVLYRSCFTHILFSRQAFQAARCGHFPNALALISVSSNIPSAAIVFMVGNKS